MSDEMILELFGENACRQYHAHQESANHVGPMTQS